MPVIKFDSMRQNLMKSVCAFFAMMSFCLSGLSTIYRLQFVNVSMSRIQLQGYRLVSPSILSNKATTFQYSFLTIALLELISALLNIG